MAYALLQPSDWTGYTGPTDAYPGWTTGTKFSQTLFGSTSAGYVHEGDVIGPKMAWSISGPAANTIRFELRQGDQAPFDVAAGHGSERNELGYVYDGNYGGIVQTPPGPGRVPIRTPVHIRYGFVLEPGPTNSAPWFVMGQMHMDDVPGGLSPPFSVQLSSGSDNMAVWIGYTNSAGQNVNNAIWTDTAPLVRGQHYQMEVWMRVDPSGAGHLVVERDGIRLVDYSGTIGYVGEQNSFWKIGLYRHGPTPETVAARYDNETFEWGIGLPMPWDVPVDTTAGATSECGFGTVAVVTPPGLVVTLAQAKAHMRIDTTDDDALILAFLQAAQAEIDGPDGWLGRAIGVQTLELSAPAYMGTSGAIVLPCPPLIGIVSVTYGAGLTLDPSLYTKGPGAVIRPAPGTFWPWTWGDGARVRIRYTAGYATVEPRIVAAILLMTTDLYENRSGRVAAQLVDNPAVPRLLAPYRVFS